MLLGYKDRSNKATFIYKITNGGDCWRRLCGSKVLSINNNPIGIQMIGFFKTHKFTTTEDTTPFPLYLEDLGQYFLIGEELHAQIALEILRNTK